MIFQDPMASLNERAKVDYIVSEGLLNNGRIPEDERKARVADSVITEAEWLEAAKLDE